MAAVLISVRSFAHLPRLVVYRKALSFLLCFNYSASGTVVFLSLVDTNSRYC